MSIFCFLDQPGAFLRWKGSGVIIRDENPPGNLFLKRVCVVSPVATDQEAGRNGPRETWPLGKPKVGSGFYNKFIRIAPPPILAWLE